MPSKKPGSKLSISFSTSEFTIYATCQLRHIVGRDNHLLILGAPEERRTLYTLSKDICPVCDGKEDESSLTTTTLPARCLFLVEKENDIKKELLDMPTDSPNEIYREEWENAILSYRSEIALLNGIIDGEKEEKYRGSPHMVYRSYFSAAYGIYKKERDKITNIKSDVGSGNSDISKEEREKRNQKNDKKWAERCGLYIGRCWRNGVTPEGIDNTPESYFQSKPIHDVPGTAILEPGRSWTGIKF
ncbi:hypothetical protein OCU04_008584 [Sclerotinia nivalis]|uniref:Uncharacterized protein n=1 Tax=Sclerotinia nivalis TaxID=352851 RepID=A0A9X0AIE1_9HELO|nr:hypothetical protein OCU04_008584 [Sclerotinia nivalis]